MIAYSIAVQLKLYPEAEPVISHVYALKPLVVTLLTVTSPGVLPVIVAVIVGGVFPQ